jgi:large subunit ribosomal protein L23
MARTKKVATEATETKVVEATPVVEAKATKKVSPKAKPTATAETVKTVKSVKTEKVVQPVAVTSKAALSSFSAIIRPLITEKSMKGIEKQQKVTVEVDGRANKTQVKLAFEATYKVKVKKVNIVNVRPKYTRRGQYPGTISGYKKAIVTLVSGQGLDLFKE